MVKNQCTFPANAHSALVDDSPSKTYLHGILTELHTTQGDIVMRKMCVCPSVRLSNARIVTKREKLLSVF